MPAWAAKFAALAAVPVIALSSLTREAVAQTSDLVSKTAFRVCADPANSPMSNEEGTGYENAIAELFAAELDLPLHYTWYPMATGFVRNTLGANRCDVVIGYAQGAEMVLTTNHYFTSAYALVVPEDGPLAEVETLSDPALAKSRIGIIAGSPPATHLARNGLLTAAKSYALIVDRRYESPAVDLLDDLAAGVTDAAVLWGPLAGPLVKDGYPGLKVVPLIAEEQAPRLFFRDRKSVV